MRLTIAFLISPVMMLLGYRFSKAHRQENRWTYRLIDTVAANHMADVLDPTVITTW